jgi:CubicO group peptidase (beta-lactamase class C family)
MADFSLSRRAILTSAGAFIASNLLGCGTDQNDDYGVVDAYIRDVLKSANSPGIAACVVRGDQIDWSAGYGWADIAGKKPMTPDTIQNIASVSKTITATAIMQLWEEKRFGLDDDVGEYFPFPIRNPRFPSTAITIRQLLTHTSSITDGPAYEPSYACGDPTMSLMDWLQAYYDPLGNNYDADNNFLTWMPGTLNPPDKPRAYSNLAFGLLGGLVEITSGQPFADYCQQRIFDPLAMHDTGWFLNDIDEVRHAVPYGAAPEPRLLTASDNENASIDSKYYGHCLYSFTNYPDGLVRTSINDLSKFLRAYIGFGQFHSARILNESTVQVMLTESHGRQGLCWSRPEHLTGDPTIWGHSGGDPGVSTTMEFSQRHETGVIVFSNFDGWDLVPEVSRKLFRESIAT